MSTTDNLIKTKDLLDCLKKKGKRNRDRLANDLKTSPQRINGFVDSMEEFTFVTVDRTVRPYQVEINDVGKKVLTLLAQHSPSDIVRKGIDHL